MATTDHPSFARPEDPNIRVWRYMDFAKFVSLALTNKLFFPRASLLGDPFEGSSTKAQIELRNYIMENRHSDPNIDDWFKDLSEDQLKQFFSNLTTSSLDIRESCHVSCWHMNMHESAAMWNIFSKSNESIAIQTTYSELDEIFPSEVIMGKVRYIDFDVDYFSENNALNKIAHKRLSFQHEQELRAIVWKPMSIEKARLIPGSYIDFDVNKAIQNIYVNPDADDWFLDTVTSFVETANIQHVPQKSALSKGALW